MLGVLSIVYENIDFSKLKKLDVKSLESSIYLDEKENQIYKIFENVDCFELNLKLEKLKLLESRKVNKNIVVPNAKIVDTTFIGVREDYISGVDLCDANDVYSDKEIFDILNDVSVSMESIHKDNIIFTDLNFGNIRIDKEKNHHFLDVLSYSISKIPSSYISYIAKAYMNKNGKRKIKTNANTDKLTFLLLCINTLMKKDFFDVTIDDFDHKIDEIPELKKLRQTFIDLKEGYYDNLPYLYQLM